MEEELDAYPSIDGAVATASLPEPFFVRKHPAAVRDHAGADRKNQIAVLIQRGRKLRDGVLVRLDTQPEGTETAYTGIPACVERLLPPAARRP